MQAGFLDSRQGAVFYILHPPVTELVRGCILYSPPFAEELNKSRRMVALQARQLAAAGYAVLLLDLYGCGDSGGEFEAATWSVWQDDLDTALGYMQQQYTAPLIVWGLRTGCLLLSNWLNQRQIQPAATLFWQPVLNGELFLTQFLRLRVAAGLFSGQKETTAQLRARLDAGETLEVAGYALNSTLAQQLAAARLNPPPAGEVIWLEVSQSDTGTLPPASQRLVDAWRGQEYRVDTAVVSGEAFWTTQQIIEVPDLLALTQHYLQSVVGWIKS